MAGQEEPRGRPHTYLLMPGLWQADGIYYDQDEKPHLQTGEVLVEHAPDAWTIDIRLNVSGQDRRDFVSRYTVVPFPEGVSFTEWKSHTGGPEPVFGLFVIVQESILMPWHSQSGQFWGQEALSSVTPDLYLSRGFAFLRDRKAYSFATRLTRLGGGGGSGDGPCGVASGFPGGPGTGAGGSPEVGQDAPDGGSRDGAPDGGPAGGTPDGGPGGPPAD
ncbi:MAG: hypothetical protein LBT40_10940 [Deltaproteobacteria bacterium]|jgi:hypothetical protein|nr:hypothetical protein [Deltaproteobacteria bacterium]